MTNLLIRLFVPNYRQTDDPGVRLAYGRMAGWVGILCNLALFLAKLLTGLLTGSISITADAVNNLSDASSSVITIIGFKLSAKPADAGHPYGHARFEYIAGLAVAVMVLVIGIELGKTSLERILNPAPVQYGWASYLVLLLSIGVKLWMALFNRGVGRRIGSATLEATFADSRNDVITTAAVLAAAVLARATGLALDGWMGLGVAAFILVSGALLVRDTINPLLGAAPDPVLVQYVADKIGGYKGVLGTHDLLVHDYGPGRRFASAHVEMDSRRDVLESHDIIDRIERDFLQQDNIRLIIHYDPVDMVDGLRADILKKVRSIDKGLTIHDFLTGEEEGAPCFTFDVVTPPGFSMPPEELHDKIAALVTKGEGKVKTHITIDTSYAPIQH